MTKSVKSVGIMLAAAVSAVSSAHALTAPTLKAAGFSNGQLTVCVQKTPISSTTLEVQMKNLGAADSEYETVIRESVSSLSDFSQSNYDGAYALYATNFDGMATLRMRTVSGEETSEWVNMGDFHACINVTGTPIGSSGIQQSERDKALDGNMFTFQDSTLEDPIWLGYDFGESISVRGFRFYPRPNYISRIDGAEIQYANDESFSDATTVYTASKSSISTTQITEVVLDESVNARYVRILTGAKCFGNVAEFEVMPTLVPYISITRDNITNFYPVVTWRIPSDMSVTSIDVLRSTSEDGKFRAVASGIDPVANSSYTDDSANVGVLYYYKLRTNSPNGQKTYSSIATYRRWRRLDRSWSDETQLYDGVSILTQTNGTPFDARAHIRNAFDGDRDTYPDSFREGADGPLGLNFGEATWVGAVGYVCRTNSEYSNSRVRNCALFCASGNDVELNDKVRSSENLAVATMDYTFHFQEGTSVPLEGAPWWFLFGYNMSASGFFCNVNELAFFGWTQHDIDTAKDNPPGLAIFVR